MAVDLSNRTLGDRYRIGHEIGRGGMATVYRADDLKHGRPVALKVLKPELAASLGTERFLREISLTARLDHPHILPLLDSGEVDGLLYYVMPYVDGESLRSRLDREKQLPVDDALRIAGEVADALNHAHDQGIVHRDIKPENILLSGGHARVADFGIARAVSAAGTESITETGLAIGSPIYMSPEQASADRNVDARTDIYSLGCVLYEMLSGQPPHSAATTEGVFARKWLDAVPSLRVVRETVPLGVEQAVTRALAKAPADRFSSASLFAEALKAKGPPDQVALENSSRRWLIGGGALAGVAAIGLVLLFDAGGIRTRATGAIAQKQIESVAVLPLENLSGDAQQDYLAAGMHEALIVDLGKLSGLTRVSARSSVLRYLKTDKSAREIGSELGVDAVIAGTVMRSGERVRITANLVRTETEEQLWSESYDRNLRDVLTLQDEIVSAIARQVRLRLSAGDRARLARARQVNPQAYELYLKGKFHLNKLTPIGFERGLALLEQATVVDPNDPLPWAGLAYGYTMMELFTAGSSAEMLPRAKAAALRAVELDESLAEAHAALAFFQGVKEWDNDGATKSFKRALELNPNLAEAHVMYSWHISNFGDPEEAVAEMKRGVALDPLSPLYTAWLAGLYWDVGQTEDAIVEARKAMELQPDFPVALFVLGQCHLNKREYRQAIAMHQKGLALYPTQGFSWILARTYALAGERANALSILARLDSGSPGDTQHPWFVAGAYVAVGENEKAMDWLEKAYADRSQFLPSLMRSNTASAAMFKPLQGNPRFEKLLQKLNSTT